MSDPGPVLTPGVHRSAAPASEVVRRAEESGWRPVLVAPAASRADLYAALSRALELPSWFGNNLDALWDCLAELSAPTALVLAGWERYEAAEPEQAARFLQLFRERSGVDPPFAVLLA